MKVRIEILLPLVGFVYIAYFPTTSGELRNYFFQPEILVPFILVFLGLSIMSFGVKQFFGLIKSLKMFFLHDVDSSEIAPASIKGMINYSYVSSLLWILYALVVNSEAINTVDISAFIALLGVSLIYSLILSELLLRPLLKRIEFVT